MRALIDHEGRTGRRRSHRRRGEKDIERTAAQPCPSIETSLLRHETEIEGADARRRAYERRRGRSSLGSMRPSGKPSPRQDGLPVRSRARRPGRSGAIGRCLRVALKSRGRRSRPKGSSGPAPECIDTLRYMLRCFRRSADGEIAPEPALAEARIEDRRSLRGLAPIIRMASASSIPATVGLKKKDWPAAASDRAFRTILAAIED